MNKTLAKLSIVQLQYNEWKELDKVVQYCVFPYHKDIGILQKKIRFWLNGEKQKMEHFFKLLDAQWKSEEHLLPPRTTKYSILDCTRCICEGDHVVVKWFGIYHHGIIIFERSADNSVVVNRYVADFSSPTSDVLMRDAEMRKRTLIDFMKGSTEFGIVSHPGYSDTQSITRSVVIAKYLIENKMHKKYPYNWLTNNCECFVLLCKTGLQFGKSQEAHQICDLIIRDMKRGNDAEIQKLLETVVYFGSLAMRRIFAFRL